MRSSGSPRLRWWRADAAAATKTTTTTAEAPRRPGKTLTVGSDIPYAPFEFGSAPYQGLDVDVVDKIAKGSTALAKFKKTPFDTIFRDLAQGKFDMVAPATTITAERKKEVDFSDPYFPADQSLMVKKGSDIKTVDDLAGKVIGAQLGTTGAVYAKNKTKAEAPCERTTSSTTRSMRSRQARSRP